MTQLFQYQAYAGPEGGFSTVTEAHRLQTYPDRLDPDRLVDQGFIWSPPGRSTETQAWSLQTYPDSVPAPLVYEGEFTYASQETLPAETQAWLLQTYPDSVQTPVVHEGKFVYESWETIPPVVVPDFAWYVQHPGPSPIPRLVDADWWTGVLDSSLFGVAYIFKTGLFKYVAANYGSGWAFYFEAYHRATGTSFARLVNIATGVPVPGSTLSTTSATLVRQRSVALTLTDGEYQAEFGKVGADSGHAKDAEVLEIFV